MHGHESVDITVLWLCLSQGKISRLDYNLASQSHDEITPCMTQVQADSCGNCYHKLLVTVKEVLYDKKIDSVIGIQ